MNEYLEYVENLAKVKENTVFFSSGPIHASIIMSKIFQHSKNEIKIFCGGFSGAVSNDSLYLNCLEKFLLKENTKLKILVEDYENNKHSKIYELLKKYKQKVQIFSTKQRVVNSEGNKPIHFTIGDDTILRLETNVVDFSSQTNFNSPDANVISEIFDKMFGAENNLIIEL